MASIELPKFKCTKCGHIWVPKREVVHYCPNCNTALSKYKPEVIR